jgi:hypothetical protein
MLHPVGYGSSPYSSEINAHLEKFPERHGENGLMASTRSCRRRKEIVRFDF